MNSKNVLLFSFLIVLLVCCKHKDETEPRSHLTKDCGQTEFNEIDSSLTQQFLFKKGTYWIYKDSINNNIDSCYCYGPYISSGTYTSDPVGPGLGTCDFSYTYATNITTQQDSFRYRYYIEDKYIRLVSPFAQGTVVLCSNDSGDLTGDNLSLFYPTITINASTYTNVYKFHFQTMSSKFNEGYFYLKPGVGIIKTELYESYPVRTLHVHELMRYHIE